MIRSIENQSRRRFLKGTAGLTLAMYLPWSVADGTSGKGRQGTFEPNAFLRIGEDNVVTVISKHLEMGQGAYTGLATLVAEELDADWAQVRVESAPAESRYNNSLLGMQGTGGSSSIANSWEQLRTAGATARAMLVSAAAWLWKVPAQEIEVADGVVRHPASGKQATLGQLAKLAGEQPVPAEVKLKEPAAFKLIGRQRLARKDSADKVNGKAIYTQDIHLPGMLTAVVAHAPRFGAKVKSFDARAALALPGVMHVVQIPSGVAVVAKDTWSAKKGRDALTVEWDESGAFKQSSGQMLERYRELAKTQGTIARDEGDVIAGLAGAARTLHAEYDFPFLAHSAMEPMNCVVSLTKDGCDTWHGAQMQSHVQKVLAQLFDLPPAQVRVHTLYAGGSFGRRASKDADYVLENAHIVKAIDGKAPVKLVWLREDDMQAGHYRPMYHHRLSAGLDEQGRLIAWQHRLVGQSVFAGSPFAAFIKDGIDSTSVEGGSTLPYRIPNLRVDLHTPDDIPIPIQWWRVVGHSHNAFSTECFFDELAQMAGQDPVAWRLAMLEGHSRHLETLKLVASKAGWDQPLAPGKQGERRGRGVALHEAFGSVVAQVAEVTVQRDGTFKVDRVVCAVECGIAVNPDVIRAQVEGSVGFALSAALREAITLTDGKVDQSNFHNNEPLRIYEMPEVLVHIVPSASVPSGIGEPPVAPLAPALVNALTAATGTRIRRLPIGDQLSV